MSSSLDDRRRDGFKVDEEIVCAEEVFKSLDTGRFLHRSGECNPARIVYASDEIPSVGAQLALVDLNQKPQNVLILSRLADGYLLVDSRQLMYLSRMPNDRLAIELVFILEEDDEFQASTFDILDHAALENVSSLSHHE